MNIIVKKILWGLVFISLLNNTGSPMKVNVIDLLGESCADTNILQRTKKSKKIDSYAKAINTALAMDNVKKIKRITDETKKNLTREEQKQLLLSNPFLAQAALCKDEESIPVLLAWGISCSNELNSQERFNFLTKSLGPQFTSPLGTIINHCCWVDLEIKNWIENKIKLGERIIPLLESARNLLLYEDFLRFCNDGFLHLKPICSTQLTQQDDRGITALSWFLMTLQSLSNDAFKNLVEKNRWIDLYISKEELTLLLNKSKEESLTRNIKISDPKEQKPIIELGEKTT